MFCNRSSKAARFLGSRNASTSIRHSSVFPNVASLLCNRSQIVAFLSPPELLLEVAKLLTVCPLKCLGYSLSHKLTFFCIQLHPLSVPICTRNSNASLVVRQKPKM